MSAYFIVILSLCGLYLLFNFKHDIQMLQQNSYRLARYWRWQRENLATSWRMVDVALFLLMMAPTLLDTRMAALIAGMAAITKIWLIIRKKFKKPLVFTPRVIRIYTVTGVLGIGAIVAVAICCGARHSMWGTYNGPAVAIATALIIAVFSWVPVMLAVVLLTPLENLINARYRNQAVSILRSMPDLKIIGITGSYGKTSTKHYLHRILSEEFDVLMTPGSYNTPMGVIRTVRELMKPYNQVFICEMGAKQKGDVKEICDMVHPHIGIVTAVGPMHLESFKTIENVQSTKFELTNALPSDGLAVVNNDFEYCADRAVDNVRCERYGISNPEGCELYAENVHYLPSGTEFTAKWRDGKEIRLYTKLVGECNISNLLAAIAVAVEMGVPEEKIRYAVGKIEQVEHRLNIKQTPGGITIIDDAFNSNPAGSKMAVDVLSHFKDSGKRIIVTPGMIELGNRQKELNHALGEHIGRNVDIAVIVGRYNREALVEGIRAAGFNEENLHTVESFQDAQTFLSGILRKGDTVLYENDLPDTFK